jgi:probable rRNA maturation factor
MVQARALRLKLMESTALLKGVALPKAPLSFEVSFISQKKSAQLNKEHLGKDYPTDVLSFHAPEVFWKQGFLGELLICKSVLVRQASEMGHLAEQELAVLMVHGFLHLLGFDHQKKKDAHQMHVKEKQLLEYLGSEASQLKKTKTQTNLLTFDPVLGLIERAWSPKN